ncbi:MAG: polysaccharide pyruvyl transferase family protein [Streptosporangiaceae bacterium]|jgi:polysaccharide pyruvyl transferase WcaK-like protein/GT2 family glycosyltransferase
MRILVDQSGYDLLNIGDVAMLQACVARLRMQWPGAEIMVIAHESGRLAAYCPGTIAIGRTFADLEFFRFLPRKPRLAAEQAWKIIAPYFSARLRRGLSAGPGRDGKAHVRPRTAIQAVHAADLVVASGGAYVTDTWWWHGAGVLSLLALAQRLGKPTAMFGQGFGPIGSRALRAQARSVLPGLKVLGLREDRIGRDLALSLGIPAQAVRVTGDDVLEVVDANCAGAGQALGVNVRVSGYASVNTAAAAMIGDLVVEAAAALQARVVALPVSRYMADDDASALRALLREHGRADVALKDIATPDALAGAARSCRAIVTGSYHAGVFSLAQGVPAVCLTRSSYYDAKFGGLRALFPGACFVLSLDMPDFPGRLRAAIQQAWHLPEAARSGARDRADQLRGAGLDAYAQFRAVVEKEPLMITADGQGSRQGIPSAAAPDPVPAATGGVSQEFSPARIMDVELTQRLPAVAWDGQHGRVWVLGRLHSEPIGVCVISLDQQGLSPERLGVLLWRDFREPVAERLAAAGRPGPAELTADGLAIDPATWPFLVQRQAVLAAAPFISVVICTRNRPDGLAACLRCLGTQMYPKFEVVVVDNAPSGDAVRAVVQDGSAGTAVQYVLEPRPGLSWARNAGIAAAAGEIIAFLDDDEEPDCHWLAGLACGFAQGDDIGCVSGMVLPARLDTRAQELFELLGGHCKGRGFAPAVFSRHGPQSPLFPLPPFGVGANMAFTRDALARIGGFDVALGAGTPALAGEDTLALTLVLLAGYRVAYEPAALMRHHHRRDLDSLSRQLQGYSVGLTAYYAALLRHRPGVLPALLRLLPAAAAYFRGANAQPAPPRDAPPGLRHQQRRGMLTGPAAYVRSLRQQARAASTARPAERHGHDRGSG